MSDPTSLRRAIFHTAEEWEACKEDLDGLLATCLSLQHWIEGALPDCAESAIALEKLTEFAMWTRLLILRKGR